MGDLFSQRQIETASGPVWVDFLSTHAPHCERRGVKLTGTEVGTPGWYRALDRLINGPDHERPETLAEALARIARLACESGHARIQEVMVEQGGEGLVGRGERLTPCELAIRAYVHRRPCFDLAYARHRASYTRRFVELMPRTPKPIGPQVTAAAVDRLRTAIGAFYEARNHTGFADVDVRRVVDTNAYAFALVHGRAPRIVGLIDEREQRASARQVHEKQDVIHVDAPSGRLGISVATPVEEAAITRAFAEAMFDDPDHYQKEAIYTGAPLVEQGIEALDATQVAGVERVQLKRLQLAAHQMVMNIHGEGLQGLWHTALGREALRDATVTSMHLHVTVRLPKGLSVRSVTLTPPNRIELDRRGAGELLVRNFLERRGFARGQRGSDDWLLVDAA